MITTGFAYIATIMFIGAILKYLEVTFKGKFFQYIPAFVLLYFIVMVFSTLHIWEKTDSVNVAYKTLKDNLSPAMLFLMLLRCDLRQIWKLGPKMLVVVLSASATIMIGFILTFAMFHNMYPVGSWKAFAALCGSWIGGTNNMLAVQAAFDAKDSDMGYVLLMDSINYAIWVMLLLGLVRFSTKFNTWTKADTSQVDNVASSLEKMDEKKKPTEFKDLILLVGLSLIMSAISQYLAPLMPNNDFLNASTWTVIIVTIFGTVAALTPMGKIAGSMDVANVLLYLIIGLVGSRADFKELGEAPLYIISGFMILGIHGGLMVLLAKIFKWDLFSIGVSSLANIGATASAPVLAAAYSTALIPIGVLMALLGFIVGTGGGLVVGMVLRIIAGE